MNTTTDFSFVTFAAWAAFVLGTLPGAAGYARVVTAGIFSPRHFAGWQGHDYEHMAGTPASFYRSLMFGRLMPLWYFGLPRLGVEDAASKCKLVTKGVDAAIGAVVAYTEALGAPMSWWHLR